MECGRVVAEIAKRDETDGGCRSQHRPGTLIRDITLVNIRETLCPPVLVPSARTRFRRLKRFFLSLDANAAARNCVPFGDFEFFLSFLFFFFLLDDLSLPLPMYHAANLARCSESTCVERRGESRKSRDEPSISLSRNTNDSRAVRYFALYGLASYSWNIRSDKCQSTLSICRKKSSTRNVNFLLFKLLAVNFSPRNGKRFLYRLLAAIYLRNGEIEVSLQMKCYILYWK